jgi:predicted RNA binding protein YcfA (HicA-like mRNA interferase family)
MTYTELTRKLVRLGVEFRRFGKGSHEVWWHPTSQRYTSIPHHSHKDIAPGTLRAILRDLGISAEDLRNA